MILSKLEYTDRYTTLHPDFAKALAFLSQSKLEQLPPGRHEIDGERIYAVVSREQGRSRDKALLEAHREYIDIHLVLGGTGEIGWKSRSSCTIPDGQYNLERDFELFADSPDTWVAVSSGVLVILFPEDAHAPLVSAGELHIIVVKVATG